MIVKLCDICRSEYKVDSLELQVFTQGEKYKIDVCEACQLEASKIVLNNVIDIDGPLDRLEINRLLESAYEGLKRKYKK